MESSAIQPLTCLTQWREKYNPPLMLKDAAKLFVVSTGTVSRWETGARKIETERRPEGFSNLERVSKVTGIPPRKLRPDLAVLFFPSRKRAATARGTAAVKSKAA